MFLESLVAADKAETALRCYFITHQGFGGVSDLDQYGALRAEQQRAEDERHQDCLASVGHRKQHNS